MGLTSEQWWRRVTLQLAKELAVRGLRAEDVVTIDGLGVFLPRGREVQRLCSLQNMVDRNGVCGPPPDPLFTVVRIKFWLFDDIFAWLVPMLDRRGERNRSGIYRTRPNSSGFHGVGRIGPNRWAAFQLPSFGGGKKRLGSWDTPEDAARAVDRARIADGYPPVNFPDDVETTKQLPDPRDLPGRILPPGAIATAAAALLERHDEVTAPMVLKELNDTLGRVSSLKSVQIVLNSLAVDGRLQKVGRGRFAQASGGGAASGQSAG